MTEVKIERAYRLFTKYGPVMKMKDLRNHKLFSRDVEALVSLHLIRRLKAGYYVWVAHEDNISEVELAAALIPQGIICLQSAAQYYDLTTLNPTTISIAIPSNSMRPVLPEYPPIDLFMMPHKLFELGLIVEGKNSMRIYDRERTVCDFFRKRNILGEDLAIEVLRSYMQNRRRLQKLLEYAEVLRLKTVIKPYVEALV